MAATTQSNAQTTAQPRRSGASLATEELAAWRGFLRTHSALTRELDAELVAAHGLSLSAYEVLLFLSDAPAYGMRMSELADSVLLSRSGLTRLVDRLERGGLVRRQACPSDQRGQNASITDSGREAFAAARLTHLAGVRERFVERLSPDQLRTLAGLWERLAPGAAAGDGSC